MGRALFTFLYLWPLSQGALLLALCWLPLLWAEGWWRLLWIGVWVVVAGLHFVPQLPDPWRKHWELEGYTSNLYYYIQRYGSINKRAIREMAENFHSMTYYMMEPRKKRIEAQLDAIARKIEKGTHPVCGDDLIVLAEQLKKTSQEKAP